MKGFSLLLLLVILFASDYALAQNCPCDTSEFVATGITGSDIVDLLCPGRELGKDTDFIFNPDEVSISSDRFEYQVLSNSPFCRICDSTLMLCINSSLSEQELESCRAHLIRGCDLKQIDPIPTLSEWGMIAMAGVLGIIGMVAASRRRKAAA